jgi:hypothetical protein
MPSVVCRLLLAAAVAFGGCGPTGLRYAPVKGTVTLDDKPIADGVVTFTRDGEVPIQLTITNGRFDGKVVAGVNRVQFAVFKHPPPQKGPPPRPGMEPSSENILPARYHQLSDLTREVTDSGPNEFEFALTSK